MRWALAGLLLFAAGFVLLHGREAMLSGSWRYTIAQADEYAFWVIADSFADDPISDGNPFYYEQMGERNPPFAYPVVAFVGYLAAVMGVPAIYFLPVWKIGAPFVTWLALWWCLVRFWGVPMRAAAAASMLVLVIPQYVHGPLQFSLLRFSRPLDTVALVAVWLSVALNPQRTGWWYLPVVGGLSIPVFFLSPFYGLFGVWVLGASGILSRLTGRSLPSLKLALMSLTGAAVGGGLLLAVRQAYSQSPWLQATLQYDPELDLPAVWSFVLVGAGLIAVLSLRGRAWTRFDVALGAILSIDPVVAHDVILPGPDLQLAEHRYYYQIFQLMAITGWLWRALPRLDPEGGRHRWEVPAIGGVCAMAATVLLQPELNYFRHLPLANGDSYGAFDNALLLLGLVPLVVVAMWFVRRTCAGQFLRRPSVAGLLVAAFALCGFATQPSSLREYNEVVGASGPHTYLQQHASPGEVLLSVPWDYMLVDYAPLYSPVKVFHSHYGQRYAPRGFAWDYRRLLHAALLAGRLNEPSRPIERSLDWKLSRLRLDYVLASKGAIGDMAWQSVPPDSTLHDRSTVDLARSQLGSHLTVAYEDEDFILWRVHLLSRDSQ
ncbi:MAG: hypothetical protein O2782_14820 [bacterium]|nr:hypothetical protein [bacterium]